MPKLTDHFTVEEFEYSEIAIRRGISNKMTIEQAKNAQALCYNVLEPLRKRLRQEVHPKIVISISSGFRSPEVNRRAGGYRFSQHKQAMTTDIDAEVNGKQYMSTEDLYQFIKNSDLPYDDLIQEYNSWVHISYDRFKAKQRRKHRHAIKVNGETKYIND